MQQSDENLLDFWTVRTTADNIFFVDEATARRLVREVQAATWTATNAQGQIVGSGVQPEILDVTDLYGARVFLRADLFIYAMHSSPESRAIDDRHGAILMREADSTVEEEDA
jgi:hypothetical protein